MLNYIMSENMKFKNTFTKKLVFFIPVISILITLVLGAGELFQLASYNYLYTAILPGVLTLISAGIINKDTKKLKGRALLGLPIDPAKLWISKICLCIVYLFIFCIIFLVLINISSVIWGRSLSFTRSIYGISLIFITFLWQIPLCLFMTDKIGTTLTLLINFSCNVLGVILAIEPLKWIIFPYGITSRIMCPAIGVLPNALKVPVNSPLKESSVIFIGVIVSILLFVFLSALTALLFRKKEVK